MESDSRLVLGQADIDRIEEVLRQFDPEQHFALAATLDDLDSAGCETIIRYTREQLRGELMAASSSGLVSKRWSLTGSPRRRRFVNIFDGRWRRSDESLGVRL